MEKHRQHKIIGERSEPEAARANLNTFPNGAESGTDTVVDRALALMGGGDRLRRRLRTFEQRSRGQKDTSGGTVGPSDSQNLNPDTTGRSLSFTTMRWYLLIAVTGVWS